MRDFRLRYVWNLRLSDHALLVLNLGFHNFSRYDFSNTEQRVLGYGSAFRPTANLPAKDQVSQDLDHFERRQRWRDFFHNRPFPADTEQGNFIPRFHLASRRVPPKASAATETALLEFRCDLLAALDAHRFRRRPRNLSATEETALKQLNFRKDIVIRDADKNLGTVVLNADDYANECYRQLSEDKFYRLVTTIPESHEAHDFNRSCGEFSLIVVQLEEICEQYTDFLKERDIAALFASFPFKPAPFYTLPKIHKAPGPCGIKGRPIVSCIGYCTSQASRFIDHHIQEVVRQSADTVLRDTNQLVQTLLDTTYPANCKILTADVESLYTNMEWGATISAINLLLSEAGHPLRRLLVDLVRFVLENNYLIFQTHIYHQEFGMAMGTPMAVNIANAFLFVHERQAVALFQASLKFFGRFVDDLFLLAEETFDLDGFQESVYSELPDIRLTWTPADDECAYMDLFVFKGNDFAATGKFSFKTYQKPRNAYLYIPFRSDHPRSNFRAFIKAELLRYNRTNKFSADIQTMRDLFWVRLRRRGYPPWFLRQTFDSVAVAPTRPRQLKQLVKQETEEVVFSTPFHPFFQKFGCRSLLTQAFGTRSVSVRFRKTKRAFY